MRVGGCRLPESGWAGCAVLAVVLVLLLPSGLRAQGSGPPKSAPPPAAAPKRKTLEVRGQAPAPEVVTVRPREVPTFSRQVIVPALYDAAPARRTIVLLPGAAPAPARNPTRSPE